MGHELDAGGAAATMAAAGGYLHSVPVPSFNIRKPPKGVGVQVVSQVVEFAVQLRVFLSENPWRL